MSAVGHRIWVHMQTKGPYNKRAFARFLERTGTLKTSHQSISNWLRKDEPPTYFVNAVVSELGLTCEEEVELWRLYFHGTDGKGPGANAENWAAADRIEAEEAAEMEDEEGDDGRLEDKAP